MRHDFRCSCWRTGRTAGDRRRSATSSASTTCWRASARTRWCPRSAYGKWSTRIRPSAAWASYTARRAPGSWTRLARSAPSSRRSCQVRAAESWPHRMRFRQRRRFRHSLQNYIKLFFTWVSKLSSDKIKCYFCYFTLLILYLLLDIKLYSVFLFI